MTKLDDDVAVVERVPGLVWDLKFKDETVPREADWNTTIITDAYGYVPIRDKFFDLLKEKVWRRSKETPRPASAGPVYVESAVDSCQYDIEGIF